MKEKRRVPLDEKKISHGVFDDATLFAIEKLMRERKIEKFSGIISIGKEANVYHGFSSDGKEIVIKIYAVETSDFRNMDKYLANDVRFPKWKNRRHLVHLWAKREFHNLWKIHRYVNCPEPVALHDNVLVMSFIGSKGIPAPKLKDVLPENPEKTLEKILNFIKVMYMKNFVHGDLSEYNILYWKDEPWLIDFSMGVLITHPLAEELLIRDVRNVLRYFKEFEIKKDENEVLEWVKNAH
ncbi:MAG: serine protein kinase RIO [Candidatus Altiarchaeota archaeon]